MKAIAKLSRKKNRDSVVFLENNTAVVMLSSDNNDFHANVEIACFEYRYIFDFFIVPNEGKAL